MRDVVHVANTEKNNVYAVFIAELLQGINVCALANRLKRERITRRVAGSSGAELRYFACRKAKGALIVRHGSTPAAEVREVRPGRRRCRTASLRVAGPNNLGRPLPMQIQHVLIDRVRGHTFLRTFPRNAAQVVDLGMHRGEFARVLHGKYGCLVLGLEANPILASANSGIDGLVCKNFAVSAFDGSVEFSIDEECPEASRIVSDGNAASRAVITVPSISLERFLQENGIRDIDLLKMDIEGAELDVIETTDTDVFRRCKQITIEFHSFLYPSQRSRVENAIRYLSNIGFHQIDFSTEWTDVLFVNKSMIDFTPIEKASLVITKYRAGIGRRLRRIAGNRTSQ